MSDLRYKITEPALVTEFVKKILTGYRQAVGHYIPTIDYTTEEGKKVKKALQVDIFNNDIISPVEHGHMFLTAKIEPSKFCIKKSEFHGLFSEGTIPPLCFSIDVAREQAWMSKYNSHPDIVSVMIYDNGIKLELRSGCLIELMLRTDPQTEAFYERISNLVYTEEMLADTAPHITVDEFIVNDQINGIVFYKDGSHLALTKRNMSVLADPNIEIFLRTTKIMSKTDLAWKIDFYTTPTHTGNTKLLRLTQTDKRGTVTVFYNCFFRP